MKGQLESVSGQQFPVFGILLCAGESSKKKKIGEKSEKKKVVEKWEKDQGPQPLNSEGQSDGQGNAVRGCGGHR